MKHPKPPTQPADRVAAERQREFERQMRMAREIMRQQADVLRQLAKS